MIFHTDEQHEQCLDRLEFAPGALLRIQAKQVKRHVVDSRKIILDLVRNAELSNEPIDTAKKSY